MIESHRSKISEKDTSENIMHTYDKSLVEDVHLNGKHQKYSFILQINVSAAHNWETSNEKIFSGLFYFK